MEPPLFDEPLPLIGPVAYCPEVVPPDGTGTLNGVFEGFLTALGVDGGFIDGRAVGGCGFASSGFGTAGAGVAEGVTFLCVVVADC